MVPSALVLCLGELVYRRFVVVDSWICIYCLRRNLNILKFSFTVTVFEYFSTLYESFYNKSRYTISNFKCYPENFYHDLSSLLIHFYFSKLGKNTYFERPHSDSNGMY